MNLDIVIYLALIALGLPVLANGRRFTWLFAGLGGMLAVLSLITKDVTVAWTTVLALGMGLVDWSSTMVVIAALVAGVALGALTMLATRPAVALASFAGVGFVCMNLAILFGVGKPWAMALYVVAGIVAATAVFMRPDWGIIIASSLTGAGAVAFGTLFLPSVVGGLWEGIVGFWGGWTPAIQTAILMGVGVIKQARDLGASESHPAGLQREVQIP